MKPHHFIKRCFVLFLIVTLLLSGCFHTRPSAHPTKKELQTRNTFTQLLDELFVTSFEDDLISLHYSLRNPEAYGIKKPQKAFSEISTKENDNAIEELKETKHQLSLIKRSHLSEEQQRTYDFLDRYLDWQLKLSEYPQFANPLSVHTGLTTNLPLTLAEYTFYTKEDVEDYFKILSEIPAYFESALAWEKDRLNTGISMSSFELAHTAAQIDTFLSSSGILLTSFSDRLSTLTGLSESQKKVFRKNNETLVNNTVLPAFESIKEELLLLSEQAPEGYGLAHYEGGKDYYETLVQSMTLSGRSIRTLIQSLKRRLSTLEERIIDIATNKPEAFDLFFEESFSSCLSPEDMLKQLSQYILTDYPELSGITYKVEPIPKALENDSTAAYYMIPPLDRAEENRIYYKNDTSDAASLFTTLAHEGYPGHLYQQNYFIKKGFHPIYYVLNDTGYKEGWAFYAEIDMTSYCDFGTYDALYHDALTELYRCNAEYSYCISSLIDLYVNGLNYSREEISRFISSIGMEIEDADELYEFAVEEPGAYLQYYIGYLEFLNIREEAEKELGNNFSAREFHREILDYGPCTFTQLSKHMKKWSKTIVR